MTITQAQLDEWRKLAEKATRGAWKARQFDGEGWHYIFAAHPAVPELARVAGVNNGDFIAASRTAVPALVAEVERLRAALTNAAKQFEFYEREHRAKADRLHGNWDARSTEQENDYSIAAGKAATNERFAAMCRAALPEEK